MDFNNILAAVLSLGGMGLVFGVILAIASKVFAVKQDERIPRIIEKLPGANCGGCGFAGCSAYAAAICDGKAEINCCGVGGEPSAIAIAEVMGVSALSVVPLKAHIRCVGCADKASRKYEYEGISDCAAAARLGGGDKACAFSCIGLSSCVRACQFDALKIENGIAVVDDANCRGCGQCLPACPKHLISLIPADHKYFVACKNKDRGGETRAVCSVGCIGCKICEKNCPENAIHVVDNFAKIDYNKCTSCGICFEKCPTKVIKKR